MTTGYSIELLFNKEFDEYVRSLWQSCKQQNLSNYMLDIQGDVMPHIALSVYENVSEDEITSLFELYKNVPEKVSCFESSAICMFKKTLVTYINVNVNRDMLNYFENIHHFFVNISSKCSPYYLPYTIIPHISVARCDDIDRAKKCWSYIADTFEPQKLVVQKIALFKLIFDDDHKLVKCTFIDEKVLDE